MYVQEKTLCRAPNFNTQTAPVAPLKKVCYTMTDIRNMCASFHVSTLEFLFKSDFSVFFVEGLVKQGGGIQ